MNKRIEWKPGVRKLSELKPYKKNPRLISELGLKQLGESFDEIGMAQPININTDNTILSGHARYYRLKKENPDQSVTVMIPDRTLTHKQEEAVIIRMNKNVAGLWDFNSLANDFEMDDLLNWGFVESDLDILSRIEEPVLDEIPEHSEKINDSECRECPKCGFLVKIK